MGKKVKDEKEIFARYLPGPEQERGRWQQVRQALLCGTGRQVTGASGWETRQVQLVMGQNC